MRQLQDGECGACWGAGRNIDERGPFPCRRCWGAGLQPEPLRSSKGEPLERPAHRWTVQYCSDVGTRHTSFQSEWGVKRELLHNTITPYAIATWSTEREAADWLALSDLGPSGRIPIGIWHLEARVVAIRLDVLHYLPVKPPWLNGGLWEIPIRSLGGDPRPVVVEVVPAIVEAAELVEAAAPKGPSKQAAFAWGD